MLNSLPNKERVTVGKSREGPILDYLNKYTEGVWSASSEHEDTHYKIDAWWNLNGVRRSVQIKTRDERTDLGLELIKEYMNHEDFVRRYKNGTLTYGRDYKKGVDIYISQSQDLLHIACASLVNPICDDTLELFSLKNGFSKRVFPNYKNGAQLIVVEDKGSGYEEGMFKLICYIPPSYLQEINAIRSYRMV